MTQMRQPGAGSELLLRAVLTNALNSCPPERLFNMFDATMMMEFIGTLKQ